MTDEDGWHEHLGGECPVPPETMVDIEWNTGAVSKNTEAGFWSEDRDEIDFWQRQHWKVGYIIAYRILP